MAELYQAGRPGLGRGTKNFDISALSIMGLAPSIGRRPTLDWVLADGKMMEGPEALERGFDFHDSSIPSDLAGGTAFHHSLYDQAIFACPN